MKAESTVEAICNACAGVVKLAPNEWPPDLPSNELLDGAPEWYPFERRAWEIGESIRQSLAAKRTLRANLQVQDCLLAVVRCNHLRRGRQPFVTNLGYVAAGKHSAAIAKFLNDPDIGGQVLDALVKMKAPGFSAQVWPLLSSRYAWVRKLAKKYLKAFPEPVA